MKDFITAYLSFTKKERTGIITLLTIIILLILLPFSYSFFIKPETINHEQFEKEIASLQIKKDTAFTFKKYNYNDNEYTNYHQPYQKNYYTNFTGEMFTFDPNTLSTDGWKKLGVRDKTIQTIQNYLSKGGKFYKPEDLEKIWGLRPEETERLIPYVQIEQVEKDRPFTFDHTKKEYKTTYAYTTIDINLADTTALIALPGIGSKLAQRIITFRDKLGGFYKAEQIAETFGLTDSTYQKIKTRIALNNNSVKQININTASIDELKIHPYIKFNIANAIVQYRTQHGDFKTIEDLKKIMLIDEIAFSKIKPYIKL